MARWLWMQAHKNPAIRRQNHSWAGARWRRDCGFCSRHSEPKRGVDPIFRRLRQARPLFFSRRLGRLAPLHVLSLRKRSAGEIVRTCVSHLNKIAPQQSMELIRSVFSQVAEHRFAGNKNRFCSKSWFVLSKAETSEVSKKEQHHENLKTLNNHPLGSVPVGPRGLRRRRLGSR